MVNKKKFIPLTGDLERLTSQEREAYLLAACEFLQVPSELGQVELTFMDSGDGKRQLVLYVKRGATDIIRDRRKINVDSMVQTNGEGYVGWVVTGHDSAGRQEIAVGAVSTKGLSGKAIADAVMTAQTKGCRRLTLQFAGGGFLDELEVNEKTTSIVNAPQPLSILAPPSVRPSVAPGRDITPPAASESFPTAPSPILPSSTGASKALATATVVETPQTEPPSDTVPTNQTAIQIMEPPKKKRGRPLGWRKKTGVILDSPEQVKSKELSQVLVAENVTKDPEPTPAQVAAQTILPKVDQAKAAAIVGDTSSPVILPADLPNKEQKKAFQARLFEYTNTILPKAGFVPTEKVGGTTQKMKMFLKIMRPDIGDTKYMTVQQFNEFFAYLDERVKNIGAEELVKFIDAKIGEALA